MFLRKRKLMHNIICVDAQERFACKQMEDRNAKKILNRVFRQKKSYLGEKYLDQSIIEYFIKYKYINIICKLLCK